MSEDCQECGRKLSWGGQRRTEHSKLYHQGVREGLLMVLVRQLAREAELRVWEAQNAAEGLVGIRWRCGVYPGWQSEERCELPQAWWDGQVQEAGGQEFILRAIREHLAGLWEAAYGVKVNPATWFHRVYDPRVREKTA